MLSLILTSLFFAPVKAQTWDEFFRQKKTQQKYLVQQIGALKIYAGYLKQGYEIAGSGINTVKNIRNGEFGLHQTFISSLKAINPAIRDNSKVADIIAMQLAISKSFNHIKSNAFLSADNREYIRMVRKKVFEECAKDLQELLMVITSGKLEMKDDERIKRLNRVYASMKDKSAFIQRFINEASLLIAQNANEQRTIEQLKKSYEIN